MPDDKDKKRDRFWNLATGLLIGISGGIVVAAVFLVASSHTSLVDQVRQLRIDVVLADEHIARLQTSLSDLTVRMDRGEFAVLRIGSSMISAVGTSGGIRIDAPGLTISNPGGTFVHLLGPAQKNPYVRLITTGDSTGNFRGEVRADDSNGCYTTIGARDVTSKCP